jgi:hypothetical protein
MQPGQLHVVAFLQAAGFSTLESPASRNNASRVLTGAMSGTIGTILRDTQNTLDAQIRSVAIRKPDIRYLPVSHPEPGQAEISGSSTRAVHQFFFAAVWQRVSFFVAFDEFFVDFRI